jgi:hypothetical protein
VPRRQQPEAPPPKKDQHASSSYKVLTTLALVHLARIRDCQPHTDPKAHVKVLGATRNDGEEVGIGPVQKDLQEGVDGNEQGTQFCIARCQIVPNQAHRNASRAVPTRRTPVRYPGKSGTLARANVAVIKGMTIAVPLVPPNDQER